MYTSALTAIYKTQVLNSFEANFITYANIHHRMPNIRNSFSSLQIDFIWFFFINIAHLNNWRSFYVIANT